jgi:Antibiotic biosynthesis monooxygenase
MMSRSRRRYRCAMARIAFFEAEPPDPPPGVLYRALREDVRFPLVALDAGAEGEYVVVHSDGAPLGEQGVTLINPFEVAAADDDAFLAAWHEAREALTPFRGYLGTRLHRAEDAPLRFVNVARWSSPLMFAKAIQAAGVALPFPSWPALYQVRA